MSVLLEDRVMQLQEKRREDVVLRFPMDGDTYDINGILAIPSGGVIFPAHAVPKIGSGAVQIANAMTNEFTNPSIETDATGFYNPGSGSVAQSSAQAFSGTYSLLCTFAADSWGFAYVNPTLTADDYTFSIYVYIPSTYAGTQLFLDIRDYAGAVGTATANCDMTLTDQWQRVSLTLTLDAGDVAGVFAMRDDSAPNGSTFYVDALQIEQSAYPTPYCDGSLGDGHSWSGTEHLSSSSRTAATLNLDNQAATAIGATGSIMFLCNLANYDNYNPTIFEAKGADSNNRIIIQNWTTSNSYWAVYINGAWRITNIGAASQDPDTWNAVCFTWDFDNDDYNLFVYDSDGTIDSGNDTTALSAPTLTDMNIGSRIDGTLTANGIIDEFILLDAPITLEHFTQIVLDNENGFPYNGLWTDITSDVVGEINFSYGIDSSHPQDRMGGSGQMTFKLNNSAENSGGLIGYYSPDSANVRDGFEIGARVRIILTDPADSTPYYKFVGFLDDVEPDIGQYRGRLVSCTAVDWLDLAARLPINARLPIQEGKTGDQLMTSLLTAIDRQPEATDFQVGQDIFTYGLDTGQANKTTIMREFTKIVDSELGYGYIKGDTISGGVLTFEDRHFRVIKDTFQYDLGEAMTVMKAIRKRDRVKNLIRVITHPRDVDDNPTSTLSSLSYAPQIRAKETLEILEDYKDSGNASRKAGGTEIVTPIPGTDYTMNTADDDTGTDVTYDCKGRIISTENGTLIGYWPLDDLVENGATIKDVSVTDATRDAVLTGGQLEQTGIGDGRTSLSVDGASFVTLPLTKINSLLDGELFTIGTWVKIGASEWTDGTGRNIIDIRSTGADNLIIIQKGSTNNEVGFYYIANGTLKTVTDTSLAGDTGWHFLSMTVDYSNDRMRAYIDGVQVGSDQTGLGQWTLGDTTMVRAVLGGTTGAFHIGDMAHAFLNNEEFTAADLLAIYNAQTGGFNVDWDIGGFAVNWTITNQTSSPAYVTKLDLKGKLVRDFQPITQEASDDDSIAAYGELTLQQDMPYQEDPLVGKDASEYLLTNLSDPATDIEGVEFHANTSAAQLTAALVYEPGDRIRLDETVTGLSDADFFINGVSIRILPPGQVFCTWQLVPAQDVAFWLIGEVGFSEIGQTTYVTY